MSLRELIRRGFVYGLSLTAIALFPSGCGSEPSPLTLQGMFDVSLAGYKIKCITLTSPAYSGTATADANGAFALEFSATEVPFGCFILNSSDVQVATVYFTSSGDNNNGQTTQITETASLGTITVDAARGTAAATVAGSIVTTNPNAAEENIECPVGFWTGTVGVNSDCSGDTVTTTLWLGKDSAGAYLLSLGLNPNKQSTCGNSAFFPTGGTVTYASNVLSWSTNIGHATTVEATVATDCSQISIKYVQTGCGTCGGGADLATQCQGTGAQTCSSNYFVLTKP